MRDPSTLWLTTLRGVMIWPPAASDPQLLTVPGDLVWDLLSVPTTVSTLVAQIAAESGTALDQISSDIDALIDVLLDARAIVIVDETA